MNDDIGARLRIVHRAGCTAPSVIAAMPFATAMGRNPAIDLVADGKGAELFRCRLCGMREGEAPAAETQAPESVPAEPEAEPAGDLPDGRSTLSRAEVIQHRRAWQRGEGHPWKLAAVSEATYMRARHRYGLVPWPSQYRDKLTP